MMQQKEQVEKISSDCSGGGAVTVRHNVYTSLEQHHSNYGSASTQQIGTGFCVTIFIEKP